MSEPFQVLELFAGIGGFTLAGERVRQRDGSPAFRTIAFCECEPFRRRLLAKRFPEVPLFEDVRTLTKEGRSKE